MLQNLQKFANSQKCQLDNIVDFEKCSKTRIYLQRSAPMQPKTSEILPKFAEIATCGPKLRLSANRAARRLLHEPLADHEGTDLVRWSRRPGRGGGGVRLTALGGSGVRVSKIGKSCKINENFANF